MPTAFREPLRLRHVAAIVAVSPRSAHSHRSHRSPPGARSIARRLPRSASCASIAFAPNSDDIAFDIKTFGVSCSTGRSVAQASAPSNLRPGPGRAYSVAGFHCQGTFVRPIGKWYEHYVCRNGRTQVVFDRG